MIERVFSTEHLDYLQRTNFAPVGLPKDSSYTSAPHRLRRLWHIRSIGSLDKATIASNAKRLMSEDILVGLYGCKIPTAFLVKGESSGVEIYIGTWSSAERENASSAVLETRMEIMRTVLNSLYPYIELSPCEVNIMNQLPLCGLALGNPSGKSPEPLDGASQIDRLIRAMSGGNWIFLVLAEPVDEILCKELRNKLINEIRSVQTAAMGEGAPSPLAEHYTGLLKKVVNEIAQGQVVGAWRTAVYLLGDIASYWRLTSVYRSIFSGERSVPEPIQIWDSAEIADMAVNWAMPDMPGHIGPGYYTLPFQYQTLLPSSQLAAYIQLPRLETSGFAINLIPDFDAVPPPVDSDRNIDIGAVIHKGNQTATRYLINPKSLTRHVFIPGVTGSGKTNTIKYLLKKASELNVPYLVIEPTKREYRFLLSDGPSFGSPVVFTLGDERFAKFRMNPFEIEKWPKTSVGTHIDLLRSVFSASFGMWTPLPQVMEECLHRIYKDYGWNIITNQNHRLSSQDDPARAFPTLSDLIVKVQEVTTELGYDKEAEERVRAALMTRINSLRVGGKGCMLDVQKSLPMELLLKKSSILELEGMGDDDDKAFMIGLLLIRLAEYRREEVNSTGLQHLLVIEEAHRLLANVGTQNREEANPRGKAVETFSNLLSEIRAYGQGVIITDQVPVKLAPDIIKNTNLKIAHRVLALDDRQVLAGAMSMNERQAQALAMLSIRKNEKVAEAAVFSEGDDIPVLVGVPEVEEARLAPNKENIRRTWDVFREEYNLHSIFQTYPTCDLLCVPPNICCIDARRIAENPVIEETFAAFVLSLVLSSDQIKSSDGVKELYGELHDVMLPYSTSPDGSTVQMRCALTHALYSYMKKRGAQYGWKYQDVGNMISLLLPALCDIVGKSRQISGDAGKKLIQLCQEYIRHCQLNGPFYGCEKVCRGTCFFRYAIEPHTRSTELFRHAAGNDGREQSLSPLCSCATDQILLPTVHNDFRRQAAMCFVIQQVASWRDYGRNQQRSLVDDMITYYKF
jgi:hypothetical protein